MKKNIFFSLVLCVFFNAHSVNFFGYKLFSLRNTFVSKPERGYENLEGRLLQMATNNGIDVTKADRKTLHNAATNIINRVGAEHTASTLTHVGSALFLAGAAKLSYDAAQEAEKNRRERENPEADKIATVNKCRQVVREEINAQKQESALIGLIVDATHSLLQHAFSTNPLNDIKHTSINLNNYKKIRLSNNDIDDLKSDFKKSHIPHSITAGAIGYTTGHLTKNYWIGLGTFGASWLGLSFWAKKRNNNFVKQCEKDNIILAEHEQPPAYSPNTNHDCRTELPPAYTETELFSPANIENRPCPYIAHIIWNDPTAPSAPYIEE